MTAEQVLAECLRRQICLTPAGANMVVDYPEPPDAAFLEILRENKPALLRYLTAKRHLAAQILQGEFDGCTNGRQWHAILAAMLENYFCPLCFSALRHLKMSQQKNQQHR